MQWKQAAGRRTLGVLTAVFLLAFITARAADAQGAALVAV